MAVLCAGAFFQAGDATFQGSAPAGIVKRFCARKAFIYMLEITAQLVAATMCRRVLSTYWVAYCDNQAGMAALQKGYRSDDRIYLFWGSCAKLKWCPQFERVASECNISDPISRGDLNIAVSNKRLPVRET